jgi:aryl-alcohol dehydrogenase-like predicted oxidoreductase
MAHPSSAEQDGVELAFDEYHSLGGNCIHLHDEGGGVHSRRATGQWLQRRGIRAEFFLCTQICHAGWDSVGQSAIDRFTPEAIGEDIGTDLELLATRYLDLVYLDDNPQSPLEPVIEALSREAARGRIKAFGFRNWTAERINKAHGHLSRRALPNVTVVVTTELALASSTGPLWPEYVPFDTTLGRTVSNLGLAVFAHAADINLGQCLYGDGDATTRFRRHWSQRWDCPSNAVLVPRVRHFADARGITPRTVNVAWVLNRPFPCVAVVPIPSLRTVLGAEYECASQLILEESDLDLLNGICGQHA